MAKRAPKQGPQHVDDPDVVGPTVESVEDAPILIGREDDTDFEVVTLEGGGPGMGTFRVTAPAPQVVISQGARYVLSDRETLVYHWQVS